MSEYVGRKAPLLVAIIVAINTWHGLTPAQRKALKAAPTDMHPRVRARLYAMKLLRKDGRRTAWGERVVKYATTKPKATAEETA